MASSLVAGCHSRTAFSGSLLPNKKRCNDVNVQERSRVHRSTTCSAAKDLSGAGFDRRGALFGFAVSTAVSFSPLARADEEPTLKTFYGLATPPTSYGGYGGNANEKPKYAFEYPASWKTDVINKVQKGTQGIDSRVFNPRNKSEQVFVITLSRAGEEGANFQVRDIDSTFQGFAGADYDLLDALSNATSRQTSTRDKDGGKFYDIELASPDVTYLSSITVKEGKVFAMFVKTPSKNFKSNEDKLRGIVDSFRLL